MVSVEQEESNNRGLRSRKLGRRIGLRLQEKNWLSQAHIVSVYQSETLENQPQLASTTGTITIDSGAVSVVVVEDEATTALPAATTTGLNLDDTVDAWSKLSQAEQDELNDELARLGMASEPKPIELPRPLVEYGIDAYQILRQPEVSATLLKLEMINLKLGPLIEWLEQASDEEIQANDHLAPLLGEKRLPVIAALRYWLKHEVSQSTSELTDLQQLILRLKHLDRLAKLDKPPTPTAELLAKTLSSSQSNEAFLVGTLLRSLGKL